VLAGRIHARDRDQKRTEMANAVVRSARFATLFPDARLFRSIDTGDLTPDAVACRVTSMLRPVEDAHPGAKDSPLPDFPCR